MTANDRDDEVAAFVVAHRHELVRTALLITAGDAHLAEDLVQTALARLYVAWPRVRRKGAALAYARQVVVNAYLDETRRPRWTRERASQEPPDVADLSGDGQGWQPRADVDVRAALAALPKAQRAVVVLRHWLDLGVDDTARLLGCTSGTVKSHNARALARLRVLLEPDVPAGAGGRSVP